ncbi:MAG TPA: hypothetical protein PK359_20160, partial [Burkholderiaceae bacterium]|nr:hypothetical protein [Burkholderiaceae bacterium]
MIRRKKLIASLVLLAALSAAVWTNRLYLLTYSLGWYTDIRFPREPNRPVPWMSGPANAEQPV